MGGQKSERAKNITKMFAGKNYSHRPIFMHVARKILELAFVLIFNWIKLHFLGVRIGLTPSKCSRVPICSYYVENLELKFMASEKLSFKDKAIFFPFPPITERSRMGGNFFGIIR